MNYKHCKDYTNGFCQILQDKCDKPINCSISKPKPINKYGWTQEAVKKTNAFQKKVKEQENITRKNIYIMLILSVVVIMTVLFCVELYMTYSSEQTVEFTVKHKERVQGIYLIYTDKEVFQNIDNMLFWKFNSSDIYGRIDKGKTYKAKVNWYRIPFLSWYRNIIEIKE